jgi:hypothetical protein
MLRRQKVSLTNLGRVQATARVVAGTYRVAEGDEFTGGECPDILPALRS